MGNVSPFLGLSGATAPQPMSYAGTPGPGAAPSPWKQSGSTVYYDDGGVVVPSNVPGGAKGAGSFNTEALFVNGVPVALAGGEVVQLNPGVGIVLTPNPILTVGTIALANTAVTPGGYGDSTHVGGFTVDAQGRLTAASSTLIAFPPTPTTLPPSGPAGGALSGTYPNPTLVGGPLSNYLLLSGGTLTGPLTGTTATFGPTMSIAGAAGTGRGVYLSTGTPASNLARWTIVANAVAETGSNAGSDLRFNGFADDGTTVLGNWVTVARANGLVTLTGALTGTTATFSGSGSFGANAFVQDGGYVYTPFNGATNTGQVRGGIQFDGTNQAIGFYTANTFRGAVNSAGTLAWSGAASFTGQLSVTTNVAGVSTVAAFGNSNTGATASSTVQQSAGTRFVNRTIDYTNQYLIENAAGLPTRYSDFDTHNFRTNAGVGYAVLNSAGLTTSGGSFSAPVAMPTAAPGTNTTQGATTAFVTAAIASVGGGVPSGSVVDFAGAAAPAGWLFANGQLVSRTVYAALFAAIGTAYGAGDGSTTFAVPDLCGRTVAGLDNMGGITAKGRLNTTTMTPNATTLGATGGVQTNTATTSIASSGTNNINYGTINGYVTTSWQSTNSGGAPITGSGDYAQTNVNGNFGINVSGAGTSGAFGVVQPTIIMNKIIKT